MLQFFKNLFNRPAALPTAQAPAVLMPLPQPPPIALPRVEIASLSLLAIIERFPPDLKKLVVTIPEPDAMVALPVPSIVKQLPSGSIKMSLASIYRQAPPGTFSTARVEEKRMVEVPLGEIFKRVRPDLLKRRGDQRQHQLAQEGIDVFGDKENPYAVAPTSVKPMVPEPMIVAPPPVVSPALDPAPEQSALTPSLEMTAGAPVVTPEAAPSSSGESTLPLVDEPPLLIPLEDVSADWPDEVRAELGTIDGAHVALPVSEVGAGLAKGKVSFTWGQLRGWITPARSTGSVTPAETTLQLPLRVLAPAFLKAVKQGRERKSLAIDESIPALFAGGAATKAPLEPEVSTPITSPAEPEPSPKFVLAESGTVRVPVAKVETPEAVNRPAPPTAEPLAVACAPSQGPASTQENVPKSLGEVFGQPERTSWTPGEIVQNAVKLPQVAGAIVALQEGLVVTHKLPEGMKGEVVAAFLPQIFGRLNQYSNEMRLGEIDDVLLSSQGAYFQAFRAGQVFFAVLGKQGQALPWHALRLMADDLLQQTKK
jgi:predicted regulator of Ras-like GTPase activity (Roadblock/LC7/MglB family)